MAKPISTRNVLSGDSFSTRLIHRMAMAKFHGQEANRLPVWLEPPPYLTDYEGEVWRNAVLTRGLEWWKPADLLALEHYCRAATDLRHARLVLQPEHWGRDEMMRFRLASNNLRSWADLLGLTMSARMHEAARLRQASPAGARADVMLDAAAENAEDPLLQGYTPLVPSTSTD